MQKPLPEDLRLENLLSGYRSGIFPMDTPEGIGWYSPDPRGIIPLDDRFAVSRSLRSTLRKGVFEIRVDTAFAEVLRGCANREETWISEDFIRAYAALHDAGYAHSVECWRDGALVGGLYGVALKGAFFGESMFSRERDASKVALVALVERLRAGGFTLLDTQWWTPHLAQFGAYEVSAPTFSRLLRLAMRQESRWLL